MILNVFRIFLEVSHEFFKIHEKIKYEIKSLDNIYHWYTHIERFKSRIRGTTEVQKVVSIGWTFSQIT